MDDPGQPGDRIHRMINYGAYRVTSAPEGNWATVGNAYVLADELAADVFTAARLIA